MVAVTADGGETWAAGTGAVGASPRSYSLHSTTVTNGYS